MTKDIHEEADEEEDHHVNGADDPDLVIKGWNGEITFDRSPQGFDGMDEGETDQGDEVYFPFLVIAIHLLYFKYPLQLIYLSQSAILLILFKLISKTKFLL